MNARDDRFAVLPPVANAVIKIIDKLTRLTVENAKLKERIEKLEAALKEIKQIARTASRNEIFGIANDILGEEARPNNGPFCARVQNGPCKEHD